MIYDLRIDSAANPQVIFYKIGQPPNPADEAHTALWYKLAYYQQVTHNDHPGYIIIPTADTPNYPVGVPHRSTSSYAILVARTMALI